MNISQEDSLTMGDVDFSGVRKRVCLVFTPDAKVGDYVIVHVGFSISILNEELAQEILGET